MALEDFKVSPTSCAWRRTASSSKTLRAPTIPPATQAKSRRSILVQGGETLITNSLIALG